MNKRILSILLCLMLVVSLLVMAVPVSAENTVDITVAADKTEAARRNAMLLSAHFFKNAAPECQALPQTPPTA